MTRSTEKKGNQLHFDVHIVASDHSLPTDGNDLYLDVYDTQRLGAHVDLDQAWIDRLVELPEARDESHGSWEDGHGLVRDVTNEGGEINGRLVPWRTSLNGFGRGQHGIAPQKPTHDPNVCIIEP